MKTVTFADGKVMDEKGNANIQIKQDSKYPFTIK